MHPVHPQAVDAQDSALASSKTYKQQITLDNANDLDVGSGSDYDFDVRQR